MTCENIVHLYSCDFFGKQIGLAPIFIEGDDDTSSVGWIIMIHDKPKE